MDSGHLLHAQNSLEENLCQGRYLFVFNFLSATTITIICKAHLHSYSLSVNIFCLATDFIQFIT